MLLMLCPYNNHERHCFQFKECIKVVLKFRAFAMCILIKIDLSHLQWMPKVGIEPFLACLFLPYNISIDARFCMSVVMARCLT